jgi:GNAT superfamily N-acetyltransferase
VPLVGPPRPIRAEDPLAEFDCGVPVLDAWLAQRALDNEASGASRTYVVCSAGKVAGYYCLATGSIEPALAPGRVRRNMPSPIPTIVLGRLAVDRRYRGQGLGAGLLRDAVRRTLRAAEIAGVRAIVVHAIDETTARFYLRQGFVRSPTQPLTLLVTLKDAAATLPEPAASTPNLAPRWPPP